jgi:tRNA 2-thiocytidine biosynthesis protein TtcA
MGANVEKQAFYLLKAVGKAHRVYGLFDQGDRIAVAVSGGKDSATLLDLLRRWTGMPRFGLVAVHVLAGGKGCAGEPDVDALRAWLATLGVEYELTTMEPAGPAPAGRPAGPCFHCAWRRRKALFLAAQRLGCNKVALGHHADDVAVTTLLNLVYQGRCETMPARIALFDGRLELIRPLYLIEERNIARYAASGAFPFNPATCGKDEDQRRQRMAALLRRLESENRRVKRALLNAVERPALALNARLLHKAQQSEA